MSILELLVSMTVSLLLLGLLSYSVSSFSNSYVQTRDKVFSDRDAELALDFIVRDLESLFIPARRNVDGENIEILTVSREEKVEGQWLTLLSLTDDIESDVSNGVVRAVSYRIGFQDPIDGPEGTGEPQFALYRKVLTAGTTFDTALVGSDLRNEVWKDESVVPELTPAEDYLGGNVVDLRIKFFSGDKLLSNDPSDTVAISTDGVFINGNKVFETITSIEVSLVVLTEVGAARVEDGISIPQLIEEHGRAYSRQTAIFVQPLFL